VNDSDTTQTDSVTENNSKEESECVRCVEAAGREARVLMGKCVEQLLALAEGQVVAVVDRFVAVDYVMDEKSYRECV